MDWIRSASESSIGGFLRTTAIVMIVQTLTLLSHGEERTWTSSDGKKIVGTMVKESAEEVVLKVGTKEFTVPLTRLSEEDRAWLAARKAEQEEKNKEASKLAGTVKTFPKSETQPTSFHVYYPTAYSASNPRPMIILFSTSANGKNALGSFQASCEALGWIGVGCDTFRNGVDNSELDPIFKDLLPIIEKSVIHDPQRIYMGGHSGAASRSLQYTAKFDRPWKGVISCGGWLGKEFDLEYRKGMAVAWVNGDTDKGANGWVDTDSDVLKKRRCKTKLFTFPGGHVMAPPEILTEAMRWVEGQTEKE